MKILLITWACDRDDVSEPQITYHWVREISKRHEVTLFSVSRPERFGCVKEQFPSLQVVEWSDIKVPTFLERFRAIAKPGYFFRFNKMRQMIKTLIEQQYFDIIHHLSPFAWRYASPAYGLGVPLVRGPIAGGLPTPPQLKAEVNETFHPYKFLRKTDELRKRLDQKLIQSYRHTDCVIVAAPYVLKLLHPLSVQRVEVEIEHGLDPDNHHACFVTSLLNNTAKTELLFVGRVIRTKGVRDAVRAISLMERKSQVHFTVIGDGEDLQDCKKMAIQLQVQNLITFRGWCDRKHVERAYRQADIFLFPSFREPTGGVLLEAMTFGLPIVACDYGGPAYLVNDSFGIKVQPAAAEEYAKKFAENLDYLVDRPEVRKKMGQAACNQATAHFKWKDKMDRLDAIYASLLR